jgi:hypothetical protein
MTKSSDAYLDTLCGAKLDGAIHSMYGSALTREYAESDYDRLARARRIAGSNFAQLADKLRERRTICDAPRRVQIAITTTFAGKPFNAPTAELASNATQAVITDYVTFVSY